MPPKIDITFDNRIPNVTAKMKREIEEVIENTALDVQRVAKQGIMAPPKTGRIYIINGQRHQASAPGEFPANLTGNLVNSILQRTGESRMERFVYVEDASARYGFFLEWGAPGANIEPRPFMRPAAEQNRQQFIDGIQEALNNASNV